MARTVGALSKDVFVIKDLTNIVVCKLRNNLELSKQEFKYYKKFNLKYWENLVNANIVNFD